MSELRALSVGFFLLLALTTAEAIQVVGVLLVLTLVITPAAASQHLTGRPPVALLLSERFEAGAGRFEERDLESFLGGGTSSTGDYALHTRSVFESRAPTFQFVGEESVDSRPAIRFDR